MLPDPLDCGKTDEKWGLGQLKSAATPAQGKDPGELQRLSRLRILRLNTPRTSAEPDLGDPLFFAKSGHRDLVSIFQKISFFSAG